MKRRTEAKTQPEIFYESTDNNAESVLRKDEVDSPKAALISGRKNTIRQEPPTLTKSALYEVR